METQTVFWILVAIGLIEAIAIVSIGNAIRSFLKSDAFKQKMERKKEHEAQEKTTSGSGSGVATTLLVLAGIAIPSLVFGAEESSNPLYINASQGILYTILAFDIALLFVMRYLKGLLDNILNIDKSTAELKAEKVARKTKIRFNLMQFLTDSVPVEEEHKVETDHEYDGIRELDNNLPPWWKWGFYISIIFAAIYLLNYHVFKYGDLQIEAYEKELVQAEKEIEQYLKDQAMNVDERTVTLMTDASDIKKGKDIFMQYCKVCHKGDGGGQVGPNLTDNYWIYGGKINDIFKTVKYGAERGMKSWKDELNPIQMQQVSSFIKTLVGTHPPNVKEPEGELYIEDTAPEEAVTDSTGVVAMNE